MTVQDKKFSQFADGGSLTINDIVVGLRDGVNTRFLFDGLPGIYLPLAGGTMTGAIAMSANNITGMANPLNPQDAATKAYVDATVGGAVSPGLINQLGWYAASGSTISGLATANSGLLVTSAGGVPSIATDIPTAVTIGGGYIYRVGGTDVAVADGGTGASSATAYMPVCGGTTSTGAFQSVSTAGAVAGYVLTYVSNVALPTWQAVGAPYTPAALTRVDDTNVTLTLGGTPATALLQAVSLTLGWSGQLSVSRGGTGLSAITAHYLPIGNGTSALTLLAPNATSGIPLISQGIAADPAYGTAVVAGGGTGNTTFTAYSVICAGTTATGAFQNVSGVGTAGQVLQSNGAGALPSWATIPGATSAALTRIDDTNVTLTLGGSPSVALLAATSLTLGWTGTLAVGRGGTGASTLTGVLVGNGTSAVTATAITQYNVLTGGASNAPNSVAPSATSGVPLISQGASAQPVFGTAIVAGGGTGLTTLPSINCGRLTLTSNVPVTVSDATAATTLYFTPFEGNLVSLYDGTRWKLYNFTQLSIAIPATTSQMYDVFLYDSGGTPTLELLAWTNDTTRATGLGYTDGVLTKGGDQTRKYLGSIRTTTVSGQCEDSQSKRYVFNNYNRRIRPMRVVDTTDSWTYSTSAFRQVNANTANQLDFIQGTQEDMCEAYATHIAVTSGASSRVMLVAIGLNSTTAKASSCISNIGIANSTTYCALNASFKDFPQLGRQTLVWLEYGGGADTQTWFGDGGASPAIYQSGINGMIMG